MWLATTRGFYSAVLWDDGRICVRARARGDLERLRELVPGMTKVARSPNADYRFRAWCSREDWQGAVAALAAEVDYPNFKNAVAKTDPDRSHLYGSVWATLLRIRERPGRKALKKMLKAKRDPGTDIFDGRATGYGTVGGMTREERLRFDPTDDEECDCGDIGHLDPYTGWRICDNWACERWGEAYAGTGAPGTVRRWDDDIDLDTTVVLSS